MSNDFDDNSRIATHEGTPVFKSFIVFASLFPDLYMDK